MFDVSFTELLVIGVVALVVIGPERLPKVARTIGHLVGRAQRYVNDVKSDIQREVELDDLRKLKDQMQDAAQSVRSTLNETGASLRKPLESVEQDTMTALKGVSVSDSPAAAEQVAAASPTLAAEPITASETAAASESVSASEPALASAPPASALESVSTSEPVSAPKQLKLDGVVTDPIPQPPPHAQHAETDATAPAAAATSKPGTPT